MSAVAILVLLATASAPAGLLAHRLARAFAPEVRRLPMVGLMALAFGWAGLVAPVGPVLCLSLGLGWVLSILAVVDATTFRLPDVLTLPLALAGLVASLLLPGAPVLDHLAGAAVGWGGLAALAYLYRRLRGVEGIGLGDAKLLGAAGAWLGWAALPSVVMIACVGAFAWVVLLAWRPRRSPAATPLAQLRIPFGAPLGLAIWIVWLHGPLTLRGL